MENTPKTPNFLSFLPAVLLLAIVGWGGLVAVVLFTLPTLGPRWLFFFLGVMALSGSVMPLVYFFNRRFPSHPPADGNVIVRQAIWVGIYGSALTWLQLGRMFSFTIAAILAGALILIEGMLRLREISQWKPKE
ncbi:MAG: hypothetical protein PHQ40_16845 [Anaerolineaceae bacterium]|nr:hypothetical protein [Anaerolineaceae bacterium]